MKTVTVVNPNSSNGRTGREWADIRDALGRTIGDFSERFTERPGDATRIVREALEAGCDRIICVGGDGTNNEVVNGFFDGERLVRPDARLGFIPRGTGGDLRRTLGVGRKLADCLPVLARDSVRQVDVGRARFVGPDGQPVVRHFINITSFGIGGLVDKLVNESSKALGGKASFLIGTLRAMLRYINQPIELKVDDTFEGIVVAKNIAVANGQYFGGGMQVAPEAAPDDGLFDVIILGDLSRLEFVKLGGKIYSGRHLAHPKVHALRGRHVEASCHAEVLIDMDGEQPGRLPISLDVLPKAIRLISP